MQTIDTATVAEATLRLAEAISQLASVGIVRREGFHPTYLRNALHNAEGAASRIREALAAIEARRKAIVILAVPADGPTMLAAE